MQASAYVYNRAAHHPVSLILFLSVLLNKLLYCSCYLKFRIARGRIYIDIATDVVYIWICVKCDDIYF